MKKKIYLVMASMTASLSPIAVLASGHKNQVQNGLNSTGLNTGAPAFSTVMTNIINTIIFLVGAISVLMIVIGALRMVLSGGNPANVKSARETVLYAVVGLIIATAAYAIVQFVLSRL